MLYFLHIWLVKAITEDLYEVFFWFCAHLWFSLVILFFCYFSLEVFFGSDLWNVFFFFMVVWLWWFEEVYLRYLFRYFFCDVLVVSSWVCVHDDWRNWWFISLALYKWPQFVLAKNLPKGKIVGYLSIGLIVAKTNTHVLCWIRCSYILARFSVPCLCGLVFASFIFLRKPHLISCSPSNIFCPESAGSQTTDNI